MAKVLYINDLVLCENQRFQCLAILQAVDILKLVLAKVKSFKLCKKVEILNRCNAIVA
jgi:hypothetical protein